jgi:hypothetical protein
MDNVGKEERDLFESIVVMQGVHQEGSQTGSVVWCFLEDVHQGGRDSSDVEAFDAPSKCRIWRVIDVQRLGERDVCAEAFEVGEEAGR